MGTGWIRCIVTLGWSWLVVKGYQMLRSCWYHASKQLNQPKCKRQRLILVTSPSIQAIRRCCWVVDMSCFFLGLIEIVVDIHRNIEMTHLIAFSHQCAAILVVELFIEWNSCLFPVLWKESGTLLPFNLVYPVGKSFKCCVWQWRHTTLGSEFWRQHTS